MSLYHTSWCYTSSWNIPTEVHSLSRILVMTSVGLLCIALFLSWMTSLFSPSGTFLICVSEILLNAVGLLLRKYYIYFDIIQFQNTNKQPSAKRMDTKLHQYFSGGFVWFNQALSCLVSARSVNPHWLSAHIGAPSDSFLVLPYTVAWVLVFVVLKLKPEDPPRVTNWTLNEVTGRMPHVFISAQRNIHTKNRNNEFHSGRSVNTITRCSWPWATMWYNRAMWWSIRGARDTKPVKSPDVSTKPGV